MTMLLEVLAGLVWIMCGVYAYGLCIGYFTGKFSYMKPPYFRAIFIGIFGPMGLLTALVLGNGSLKFKGLSKEERWKEFEKAGFSVLGRDYFEQHHG